jgi:hypothetical protein
VNAGGKPDDRDGHVRFDEEALVLSATKNDRHKGYGESGPMGSQQITDGLQEAFEFVAAIGRDPPASSMG